MRSSYFQLASCILSAENLQIWNQCRETGAAQHLVFFQYAEDEEELDLIKGRTQVTADRARQIKQKQVKQEKKAQTLRREMDKT